MTFLKTKDNLYKLFRSKVFRLLYKIFCILPIKKNRILFASDSRSEIEGNFKFIYKELKLKNIELDYKFMLKKSINTKKSYKEIVLLAYYIATSKNILVDDFYPMIYPLKIRRGAELIQVWHAVGAFKKFGYSRMGLPGGPSSSSLNHKNYTKVIVSSKNVIKYYAEGFGISEEKIYPIGIPRTDMFFKQSYMKKKRDELIRNYSFLKNRKVILFAPTFRGSGQNTAYYPMDKVDYKLLYEELKNEYVFLFRLHPFVKNSINIPDLYRDFFFDFSDFKEVNNLLLITDILITDYSSICFEFSLLNKPMLFFAFDLEDYKKQRDFYFDYQLFIPGSIVKTSREIVNKITTKDFEMDKIQRFVNFFFDYKDGNSSERFIKEIIN